MMKETKTIISVNNVEYKIIMEDNPNIDGTECFGITDQVKQEIILKTGMSKERLLHTLIHELTHAFLFSYGFGSIENLPVEVVCDFNGAFLSQIAKLTIGILDRLGIK